MNYLHVYQYFFSTYFHVLFHKVDFELYKSICYSECNTLNRKKMPRQISYIFHWSRNGMTGYLTRICQQKRETCCTLKCKNYQFIVSHVLNIANQHLLILRSCLQTLPIHKQLVPLSIHLFYYVVNGLYSCASKCHTMYLHECTLHTAVGVYILCEWSL